MTTSPENPAKPKITHELTLWADVMLPIPLIPPNGWMIAGGAHYDWLDDISI